jgi:hypothetical protein
MSLGIRWSCPKTTPQQKQLLQNFFHLVIAVTHATWHSVSHHDIKVYEKNMQEYVNGVLELFGPKLVPNNHMSLHLPQPLKLFGSVC